MKYSVNSNKMELTGLKKIICIINQMKEIFEKINLFFYFLFTLQLEKKKASFLVFSLLSFFPIPT